MKRFKETKSFENRRGRGRKPILTKKDIHSKILLGY
jgi:hypothetical protein